MNRTVKRVVTALTSASIVTGALLTLDKFASRTVSFNVILAAMIILVSLVQLEFYQMIARRFAVMTLPGVLAGVVYLAGRFFFQVPNIIVPLFFMIALTAHSRIRLLVSSTYLGYLAALLKFRICTAL